MRRSREPLHGDDRRYRCRGAGLNKWQAYMAEQAAMFRGMVMLVFGDQSRGLGEQHDGEQQQYIKSPPAHMISARYLVVWDRHSLSFDQLGTDQVAYQIIDVSCLRTWIGQTSH